MNTKHYLGPLAILLACATPVLASAQEQPASRSTKPEAAGLPADISGKELVVIFEEILRDEAFKTVIDSAVTEMTALGEAEDGWNERGVFLPDLLEQRDGGLREHVVVSRGDEAESVSRFGTAPIAMPDGLYSAVLADARLGSMVDRTVTVFAPGFWIEIGAGYERDGTAICYTDAHRISVHSKSGPEGWSLDDVSYAAAMYGLGRAGVRTELCVVYELGEDGSLTSRVYNREGRPYLELNAMAETLEILPASRSAELVATMTPPDFTAK